MSRLVDFEYDSAGNLIGVTVDDDGEWVDMERVQRWISVEDRLPENDSDYLVYLPEGSEVLVCTYYGDGEWLTGDLENLTRYVTHWMPLPEPPKEVTNERNNS